MTQNPLVNPASDEDDSSSLEPECERDSCARCQNGSIDEVSDDEYWRHVHHGRPDDDASPSMHRSYPDAHMKSVMSETNDLLNGKTRQIQRDYNQLAMDAIMDQIMEAQNLRYSSV